MLLYILVVGYLGAFHVRPTLLLVLVLENLNLSVWQENLHLWGRIQRHVKRFIACIFFSIARGIFIFFLSKTTSELGAAALAGALHLDQRTV